MRTIHLLIQPLQSNASVERRFSKMKRRKDFFFRRFVKFFRRFGDMDSATFIVCSAFGSIERVVVRGLFRYVSHKEALRLVFPWSLPNVAGIRLSVKAVFLSVIWNGQEKRELCGSLRSLPVYGFIRLSTCALFCSFRLLLQWYKCRLQSRRGRVHSFRFPWLCCR